MPPLRVDLEICTFHIDFSGHVSNIVYIQWLEIGRCQLLEDLGMPVPELARTQGMVPVLLETQISYRRQLLLGDRPYLQVWISELGRASALIRTTIHHANGDIAAEAVQKGMFCSYPAMKPQKLSPDVRQKFEKFLIPEDTATSGEN